jgi:hypothetical protein
LKNFCLTLITIDFTTQLMQDFLLIGFELEIYHQNELFMIYWYYEYISNIRIKNFEKIYNNENEIIKNKKKKNKKENKNDQVELKRMLIECDYLLNRNYFLMISIFSILNNDYNKYNFKLGKKEIRYNHRFYQFSHLTQPHFLPYEVFLEKSIFKNVKPTELIKHCEENLTASKSICNKILMNSISDFQKQKINNILNIIEGNLLSLSLITSKLGIINFI